MCRDKVAVLKARQPSVQVSAGAELTFFAVPLFGICAEQRVDNTDTFVLLLSWAFTKPRPFLPCW